MPLDWIALIVALAALGVSAVAARFTRRNALASEERNRVERARASVTWSATAPRIDDEALWLVKLTNVGGIAARDVRVNFDADASGITLTDRSWERVDVDGSVVARSILDCAAFWSKYEGEPAEAAFTVTWIDDVGDQVWASARVPFAKTVRLEENFRVDSKRLRGMR